MTEVVKEEKRIHRQIWNIIDQERVVAFSDAVFAFAATLLVLKIDLPEGIQPESFSTLSALLIPLWPQYLVNIVSFLLIGYYWLNHHAIFNLIRKFDAPLVWINLVFLIFLSFIPFPVDLHGSYPTVPVIIMFYSLSLALVGYLQAAIWIYASLKKKHISHNLTQQEIRYYTYQSLLAPLIFTISLPLVIIHPLLAQLSWIGIIIGAFILKRVFGIARPTELERTLA